MRRASGDERRGFRRGGVFGLTVAEAFMLIAFALLVLMASQREGSDALTTQIGSLTAEELAALNAARSEGVLEDLIALHRAGIDPAEALATMAALAEGRVLVEQSALERLRSDADRLASIMDVVGDASDDTLAEAMRIFTMRSRLEADQDRLMTELERALDKLKSYRQSAAGLSGPALAEAVARSARYDALSAEAADLLERLTSSEDALAISEDALAILRARLRALAAAHEEALARIAQLEVAARGAQADAEALEAALARLKGDRSVEDAQRLITLGIAASTAGAETPQAVLAAITTAIGDARAAEARFASTLRTGEIGALLAGVDGMVDERGAVILPQESAFEASSAEPGPRFVRFLERFCELWTRAARASNLAVDALLIEGHASSEWSTLSADDAFRNNLVLSQSRAASVLNRCLDEIDDPEHRAWARGRLTAVGFSSSRPILDEAGAENPEASRRVVFSALVDRTGLLEDIVQDATAAQ